MEDSAKIPPKPDDMPVDLGGARRHVAPRAGQRCRDPFPDQADLI